MRSQLFVLVAAFAIGCGGGGSSDKPDAPKPIDAAPDAPAMLTNLGKPCVLAMNGADCTGTANGCLGPFVMGGTMGFCTAVCVNNGTFMTNNANPPQPTNIQPADLTAQNAQCVGLYQGPAIGTPSCTPGSGGILFNRMPTGALQPNTNYTYQVACGIGCGTGGACPAPLTCNTAAGAMFCQP
jgi:hypothetical protein